MFSDVTLPLHWELTAPGSRPWDTGLEELRNFRGRTLYAEGRRPRFLLSDGRFDDDGDGLDPYSVHIVARTRGSKLAGYARISPLNSPVRSSLQAVFGTNTLWRVLQELQLTAASAVEGGRWMVCPELRGSGVGAGLLLAYWAVGRWLGTSTGFGTAGLRDGQAQIIQRFGGEILSSVAPVSVPHLDDEIQLVRLDLTSPPAYLGDSIREIEVLLGLAPAKKRAGGISTRVSIRPSRVQLENSSNDLR